MESDRLEVVDKGDATKSLLASGRLTQDAVMALTALSSGDVPDSAVKQHPGKGGKVFTYIDHIWVTKQLRSAFNMLWSMKVSNPIIQADGSASVIVTLSVKIPMQDGTFMLTETREIGAWEDSSGKMPHAMRLAAAASRGLVRCSMRMFGIGEQFYMDQDDAKMSASEALDALVKAGEHSNLDKEDIKKILNERGIDKNNIVDKYLEAWKIVANYKPKENSEG